MLFVVVLFPALVAAENCELNIRVTKSKVAKCESLRGDGQLSCFKTIFGKAAEISIVKDRLAGVEFQLSENAPLCFNGYRFPAPSKKVALTIGRNRFALRGVGSEGIVGRFNVQGDVGLDSEFQVPQRLPARFAFIPNTARLKVSNLYTTENSIVDPGNEFTIASESLICGLKVSPGTMVTAGYVDHRVQLHAINSGEMRATDASKVATKLKVKSGEVYMNLTPEDAPCAWQVATEVPKCETDGVSPEKCGGE